MKRLTLFLYKRKLILDNGRMVVKSIDYMVKYVMDSCAIMGNRWHSIEGKGKYS